MRHDEPESILQKLAHFTDVLVQSLELGNGADARRPSLRTNVEVRRGKPVGPCHARRVHVVGKLDQSVQRVVANEKPVRIRVEPQVRRGRSCGSKPDAHGSIRVRVFVYGGGLRAGHGRAEEPHRDRNEQRRERRHGKHRLLDSAHAGNRSVFHDLLDSFAKVRAAHASDERQPRFQIVLAHVQDSLGICAGLVAGACHVFVARLFAFGDEPGAEPPDERMKPERHFNQHVERGGQVVAPTHVALLVRQNRPQLCGGEPLFDSCRQQKHRPQDTDNARLEQRVGAPHRNRKCEIGLLRLTQRASNPAPTNEPEGQHRHGAERPRHGERAECDVAVSWGNGDGLHCRSG